MARFRGYNKKNTSHCMMRIDKRERILSMIVGGARLERFSYEVAKKKYESSNIKKSNPDWQIKNLTQLTISEPKSRKDYFDWKVKKIKETGWLSNFRMWQEEDYYYASWFDTKKLRIYYKWLRVSGKESYEKILKYMYSPFFPAVLVMDRGELSEDKELIIRLNINYGLSINLLQEWFVDILGISSEAIRDKAGHCLYFDKKSTANLLEQIEPVVKEVPSMYEKWHGSRVIAK